MWNEGRASDEETLELIRVYLQINEPERRREIMELAVKYAGESRPSITQIDRKPRK